MHRAPDSPLSPLTAGEHTIRLKHDGRERSYIVHVPKVAAARQTASRRAQLPRRRRLGRAAAGLDAPPRARRARRLHRRLPERLGTLRRPPAHLERRELLRLAACRNAIDDVGFVAALLDDLARRTPVDRYPRLRHRLLERRDDGAPARRGAPRSRRRDRSGRREHGARATRAARAGSGHAHSQRRRPSRALRGRAGAAVSRHRQSRDASAGEREPRTLAEGERLRERRDGRRYAHVGSRTAPRSSRSPPCSSGAELVHWKLHGPGHVWPGAEPTNRQKPDGTRDDGDRRERGDLGVLQGGGTSGNAHRPEGTTESSRWQVPRSGTPPPVGDAM